eukprot:CAMPEP_0184652670 /NCGR_PEP_ID=MMETSP0308-20130426/10378_1 /TAXON_ID=38269 /ORGANISM="Gloeochaete witrockiana, Strain SAG 46.84" /LENGTH=58 /DNA_ID=CAMNT_0027087685 /DNA_START=338 /DNA_END=511 /DNA_ORIENTATION=+
MCAPPLINSTQYNTSLPLTTTTTTTNNNNVISPGPPPTPPPSMSPSWMAPPRHPPTPT